MKKEVKTNPLIDKTMEFVKLEHPTFKIPKTFGERASDKLTSWAGSWTFILIFLGFLVLWMIVNTAWIIFGKIWDPYPFILLNLALSCIAAIQAPIILMSQNREAEKDRLKLKYDYAVNRKAERGIRDISKRLDRIEKRLITKQALRKLK